MRTDSPQLYRQLSVIVIVMCCCYCYWYEGDWRELHPDMVTSRLRWLAGRRPAVMGRPQPAQGAKVRCCSHTATGSASLHHHTLEVGPQCLTSTSAIGLLIIVN